MSNFGWYDIKTKFKHILRTIVYSSLIQKTLCFLIANYIRFVVLTSRKSFHNLENIDKLIKKGESFIIAAWHNRLALTAFIFSKSRKINKNFTFSALTSGHGDGMIVGRIMENFNLKVINGSTRKKNDPKKGITISDFRQIFRDLKKGTALCITPDGPRGPRFKVAGEVANIAKISGAAIIPASYGISNRKVFKSWDRFIFPLPFAKIAFCFGDPIYIDKKVTDTQLKKINHKIENTITLVAKKSDEAVRVKPIID